MKVVIFLLCIYAYVTTFEVAFENFEVSYFNTKFFSLLNMTLRRLNRKSPYILNVYQNFKCALGNNFTTKWKLYEIISGREILSPVQFEVHLCDTLYKDPYIGKLFASQLPKNWTCPFPAGFNNWTNIILDFRNWPYIPVTYSSLYVRTCTYIDGYINSELAYKIKTCAIVKQKVGDETKKYKHF